LAALKTKKLLFFLVVFGFGISGLQAQIINTIGGDGVSGYSGDGGPATVAEMSPGFLTLDYIGNVYIVDGNNYRIRKIDTGGNMSTFAGNGVYGYSGDGGPATAAEILGPQGIAIDDSGNIFISGIYYVPPEYDTLYELIRKINTSGIISTYAGIDHAGYSGDGGPATAAEFDNPRGLAADNAGNIYIADLYNNRIRKINTSGIITTVAGNGTGSYSGDGGPATLAELSGPNDVAMDAEGNLYIDDNANSRIRKVNTDGIITTVAGVGINTFNLDGIPATAAAIWPQGIAVNQAGELYIADGYNYRIRKVSLNGIISTVGGDGREGYTGFGTIATSAELNYPYGIAIDASNTIYFSDVNNYVIRTITSAYTNLLTQDSSSNCNPCNGSANAYPQGGTLPYTYLWSPGGNTTSFITGICPGIYSVTVVDADDDSIKNDSIIVRSTIIKDSTGSACAGCCDCHGKAWIYAYGGTLPYTFSWSNGGTTDTISLLSHGTYTVKVTDFSGCTLVDTVYVTHGFPASVSATAAACYGASTGSATASGGTNYSWAPSGGSSATAAGLSAGVYTVTISNSDSLGCPAVQLTVTINQATPILVNVYGLTGGCFFYDDGSTIAGGTPPYTYYWSADGGTGPTDYLYYSCGEFFNTPNELTVTDHNGCTGQATDYGTPQGWAEWSLYSQTNISCNGDDNGTISVQICEAGSVYVYPVNFVLSPLGITSPLASSYTFTNLSAGTYTVSMYEDGFEDECNNPLYFTITQPTGLNITANVTSNVRCTGGSNGSAAAYASGGSSVPQNIITIAGDGIGGYNGDGIAAIAAELYIPSGVAMDGSGNIYIADYENQRIREVNTTGIINTVAGNGTGGYSGDGGNATAAELNGASGVAVDGSGNIYIADRQNQRIRKVNSSGIISTIAGNGTYGYNGDGIAATTAELFGPVGVAADGSGNIYIADYDNARIRKVNTSGVITTVAGNGAGSYSGDGGAATAAELNAPYGVAIDGSGNIYIADFGNSRIRKVNNSGIISTVVGNGTAGYNGDEIAATTAELLYPSGVAVDVYNNIYIADGGNYRIRQVTSSGIISTIAGNGTYGYNGDGIAATTAELNEPNAVAVDLYDNVYIADVGNDRIRKVSSSGGTSYSYSWSPSGGTNTTASNLSAGTFTVTVSESDGCLAMASVTITTSNSLLISASTTANVSCNGGNNGSASVSISSGTSPFTYLWSDAGSQTNTTATGLSAGTFSVTVTDSSGCLATASVTITASNSLLLSASTATNISCNGGNNGSASVSVSIGTSPYTYLWSDASSQTTTNATGLISGTYTVTVNDSCGGSATASVIITQPTALAVTADSTVVYNGSCYGSAWAIVNGGTPPYSYFWTGGLTTDTITDQCEGYYCSTVTDANGCMDSVCVTISENTSTGMNEQTNNNGQITVFPNPNNGNFTITLSHAVLMAIGIVSASQPIIELYNVLGEKIFNATLPKGIHSEKQVQGDNVINLTNQPNGVYFYRVLTDSGTLIGDGKVAIEK
jgi:sugar lactone lactonase YvrE